MLAGTDPYTETVLKGGTTYYRARFAGFDQDKAEAACKYLKRTMSNAYRSRTDVDERGAGWTGAVEMMCCVQEYISDGGAEECPWLH